MCTAWTFNIAVYATCALLCLTYANKFGANSTNEMITVWIIAMFQIYLIIEPVQILVTACAPFLCTEDSRCGRCCLRVKYYYNEFFSP